MNFHVGLFDVSEALMRIGHSGLAEVYIYRHDTWFMNSLWKTNQTGREDKYI